MNKRPVLTMMLAFVLGEMIAYYNISMLCIIAAFIGVSGIQQLYVHVFAKRTNPNRKFLAICKQTDRNAITVDRIAIVVAFLFAFLGYAVTATEVETRDQLYAMAERGIDVWTVGEVNKITKGDKPEIELRNCFLNGEKYKKILIYGDASQWKNRTIKIGNKVRVKGKIYLFEQAANKGNFDRKNYYMSFGIYAGIKKQSYEIVDDKTDKVREMLEKFREKAELKLGQLCSGDTCTGIYKAILFGNRQEVDEEVKERYQVSGIAHILAISALHVNLIGMSVYVLLRKRLRFVPAASVSLLIVLLFAVMSGMSVSTARAVMMFSLKLLSDVVGRTYDTVSAMAVAILVLLIGNPFLIFNSGFQMSFTAAFAAGELWKILKEYLALKHKISKVLILNLCITVAMNPIIAWNYYQIPLYAFALNLIIVPCMGIVIASGMAGVILSFVNKSIGKFILFPGCMFLKMDTQLCRLNQKMPFYNVITGKPEIYQMVLYYGIIGMYMIFAIKCTKRERKKKRGQIIPKNGIMIEDRKTKRKNYFKKYISKYAILISTAVLLTCILPVQHCRKLAVTIVDVGQGDGILIRTDNGMVMTIDGGSTSMEQVGKYRMIPYFKSEGVRKVDYAVITHTDEDHINGIIEMIEKSDNGGVPIKNIVLPDIHEKDASYRKIVERAKKNHVHVLYLSKGDEMSMGKVHIKCIYPQSTTIAKDRNDYSAVLSLRYDRFSMLFTGDISTEPEQMLKDGLEKRYTVLKVAHHGSNSSTSDDFLQYIHPEYSIISVGKQNMYGHPGKETLERLKKNKSTIFRTDEDGGIMIKTDGRKMKIKTYRGKR